MRNSARKQLRNRAVNSRLHSLEKKYLQLATAGKKDEAAKAVGIAPNTLLKWMKDPEFDAAYREARRAASSQATARLQQGTSAAATMILKVMIDPGTPASVKVRAAEAILNHSAKAIEIEDIESRLSELERSAKSK